MNSGCFLDSKVGVTSKFPTVGLQKHAGNIGYLFVKCT